MTQPHHTLAHHFRQQALFCENYSPLYQQLFGYVAGWLEQPNHPVGQWLISAGANRPPLEISLLLMAGIHELVLTERPAGAQLAPYYATAPAVLRGEMPLRPLDNQLETAFFTAVATHQTELEQLFQTAQVQTNETGRGLSWLLPLIQWGWPEVELLDLGASAGLNLVANLRHFQLINAETNKILGEVGSGRGPQFTMLCRGNTHFLTQLPPWRTHITGRYGVDLAPFHLHSPAAELRLQSYLWGDQPQRLRRLQEALDAYHQLPEKIVLQPVRLFDELPHFLAQLPPSQTPLLIYNTYITQYFVPHIPQLRQAITEWAEKQTRPVAWVQWEPHRTQKAPFPGWCAWLVEKWNNGRYTQQQLAWVHPHGTEALFL